MGGIYDHKSQVRVLRCRKTKVKLPAEMRKIKKILYDCFDPKDVARRFYLF